MFEIFYMNLMLNIFCLEKINLHAVNFDNFTNQIVAYLTIIVEITIRITFVL